MRYATSQKALQRLDEQLAVCHRLGPKSLLLHRARVYMKRAIKDNHGSIFSRGRADVTLENAETNCQTRAHLISRYGGNHCFRCTTGDYFLLLLPSTIGCTELTNVRCSNRNGKYRRTVLSMHSIEVALGLQ
jgi:hypothetical protein